MRYVLIALAQMTVGIGLFFLVFAVLAGIDNLEASARNAQPRRKVGK